MDDHLFDFAIRPGPIRSGGLQGQGRIWRLERSAIGRTGKALSGGERSKRWGTAKSASGRGRCSRIGRGQMVADRLCLSGRTAGSRRVVIKSRIARLKAGGGAARAHLTYLVRDGVSRDDEKARLYGPGTDDADGRAFLARGVGDRHQFRFIVAPEDAVELEDLRAFTRELMGQMQQDLGTRLDWVAVDHFNTGHPHSHVIVRGKDDQGKDLVIAGDYLTAGLRHRAEDRITLELGPETRLETQRKLQNEVHAERFTRIDQGLLREAGEGRQLDLLPGAGLAHADIDRALRLQRLKILEPMGLAEQVAPGIWSLSAALELTLRAMGERGDILKAMSRALSENRLDRGAETLVLDPGAEASAPKVGRLIGKHLIDELDDRVGLVIDGVDGRVRHVEVDGDVADQLARGDIVEAGPEPAIRPIDRSIARQIQDSGRYWPDNHREMLRFGDVRPPAGLSVDEYVEAHVRRLEALRRQGLARRWSAEEWQVPINLLSRLEARHAGRRRLAQVRLLSAFDIEAQIGREASAWLDRQLVGAGKVALSEHGFGGEVRAALEQRADVLVRAGLAERTERGGWRAAPNLLKTLERREIDWMGRSLATEQGLTFRPLEAGETLNGRLMRRIYLASGPFAVLENGGRLSLVPWRPVLERHLEQQVSVTLEIGGGVSWRFGRGRGLELGR